MTDPATVPEAPDAAETARFLRRFAGLMSNGQNAGFLVRAADLIDALTARVAASADEDQLWRYKYETLTHQNDALELECENLRHDIERHVKLSSHIIAERDALKIALEARQAELLELGGALKHEQDAAATKSQAHEAALAELRAGFDQERVELKATADLSSKEADQQRRAFEREREELSAKLERHEGETAELRLAFDRERDQLRSELTSREDELAALRVDSGREHEALKEKIEALEAKRAELRSAFDQISQLHVQTLESDHGAEHASGDRRSEAPGGSPPVQFGDRDSIPGEDRAVVPKGTLRQARAQFEFLAKECIRSGDIATQAMCELGAHTMDQALVAEEGAHASPVGEVALSILNHDPARRVGADNF